MINWLICLFKGHEWSRWYLVRMSAFVMGTKIFQERKCKRCGRIETKV